MDDASAAGEVLRRPGWFCGISVDVKPYQRILAFLLCFLIEGMLVCSPFGLWSLGGHDISSVQVAFVLVPLMAGVVFLGFVPGVALSATLGVLLCGRAALAPISYFDMFLLNWTCSVLPLVLGGAAASAILTLSARRYACQRVMVDQGQRGGIAESALSMLPFVGVRLAWQRVACIVVACLALCVCFSLGARGIGPFVDSLLTGQEQTAARLLSELFRLDLGAEIILNTALLSALCCACDAFDARRAAWLRSKMGVRQVFQGWLLIAMTMGFLCVVALYFCLETARSTQTAYGVIDRQIEYLKGQIDSSEARTAQLKASESNLVIEKASSAANLLARAPHALEDADALAQLADVVGLASLTVADGNGVVVASTEGQGVGTFCFADTEQTAPYMGLLSGKTSVVEEPRASIDGASGQETDLFRVFAGVPRVDAPGFIQVSIDAEDYDRVLSAASLAHLADNYTAADGCIVAIAKDGVFVTTNDDNLKGRPLVGGFIETESDLADLMDMGTNITIDSDTFEYFLMAAKPYREYVVVAYLPLHGVFQARTEAVIAATLFFLVLFMLVFVVVSRLLKRVVIDGLSSTNATLARITAGELDQRVAPSAIRELDDVSRGINTTVDALNASLEEVTQRMAREMAAAKVIQESALPRTYPPFPAIDQFDIFASMKAAREVGGDFYDFFLIDEKRLGFVIADVSDKGIPAALFMMAAKTQLRNYMQTGMGLSQSIASANYQLCQENDAQMFVTVFAGVLDFSTGQVAYVNAGHNPPLLYHDGQWSWLRNRSGLVLGAFEEARYREFSVSLDKDDIMLLYTDGITEAADCEQRLFGEERLLELVGDKDVLRPKDLVDAVCAGVERFANGAEQADDVTVLVLEYGEPPEAAAVLEVDARVEELPRVLGFVHEELANRLCPIAAQYQIDIALEELFVNVSHYAYAEAPEGAHKVARISCAFRPERSGVEVELADWGVAFDPLAKPDPTRPASVEEAPIGGMGIFMTKRAVDEISYRRENGANIVTFFKGW